MTRLTGKRIAILVQNLPVPFDRRVWQEALSLASAGADVTVVCPDSEGYPIGTYVIDGVRVIRYANPPEARGVLGYLREYGVSLWRMANALRVAAAVSPFHAVHFCNPPDLLFLVARRYRRRHGAVMVFDQHDLGPELVRAKGLPFGKVLEAIARLFERLTYAEADHVIATNESYKEIALRRGRLSEAEVTVVRSGPPASWGTSGFQRRDWHEGNRFLIGYVGVMGRQEGIEYLLEALHLLLERGLDVRLALCGSGPDRDRLESLAASRGVSHRTTFYGRVPDEALQSILSDADVCVNPDEVNGMNNLSTMNKIVEYMALGRPIVQFDVKEGRFSAQNASLYADPNSAVSFADRIQEVLEDSGLAESLAENGKLRFKQVLAWERQGEVLVATYARLLG